MKKIKVFAIAYFVSAAVGIIIGSLFQGSYFNEMKNVMDTFCDNIINYSLYMGQKENYVLLFRIIIGRMGPFIIMWLLSENRFTGIYILWYVVSRGMMMGFMCNFFARAYKENAPAIIGAFYFPHWLLYATVYGLSIVYISRRNTRHKMIVIMLLTLVMLAACVLETYINPALLASAVTNL